MDEDQRKAMEELLNTGVEYGKRIGYLQNLNPIKESEIKRLQGRIKELEAQVAEAGYKNPAWEAGYQHGLYVMPDEIARAYSNIDKQDPSFEDLRLLFDTVAAVMMGVVKDGR